MTKWLTIEENEMTVPYANDVDFMHHAL